MEGGSTSLSRADQAGSGLDPIVALDVPVDYSFKELRHVSELETEEPRTGKRKGQTQAGGGGQQSGAQDAGGQQVDGHSTTQTLVKPAALGSSTAQRKRVVQKVIGVVKLNNNMFENISGLPEALHFVMDNPLTNLQWLDLSFNQLTAVEPVLLQFQNLKALYMHGNCIQSLGSVAQLKGLPKLLSLTLNGNPLGSAKTYRPFVIGAVQQLKSLDHSTITEDEHSDSFAWYQAHMKRLRERAELKAQRELEAQG
mmetsp:Transcript_32728/g.76753  ORF Transcript_32728/g.76753 Transcript_32728/m.76753 type:complete len:254 (-) Transcript_32728:51-812(-)